MILDEYCLVELLRISLRKFIIIVIVKSLSTRIIHLCNLITRCCYILRSATLQEKASIGQTVLGFTANSGVGSITTLVDIILMRAVLSLNALVVLILRARAVFDRLSGHTTPRVALFGATMSVESALGAIHVALTTRTNRIEACVVAKLVVFLTLRVGYTCVDET